MNISDLKPKQGKVELEGTLKDVSPPREFQKFGKPGKVANAVLEDKTGKVVLTLWNEDAEKFKKGDKIKIVNGYVNEWQGELQLTAGRYGSLEKVEDSNEEKTED